MEIMQNFNLANKMREKALHLATEALCPYCLEHNMCYETNKHKYTDLKINCITKTILHTICHCDRCARDFVIKEEMQYVPIAIEPLPNNISDYEEW